MCGKCESSPCFHNESSRRREAEPLQTLIAPPFQLRLLLFQLCVREPLSLLPSFHLHPLAGLFVSRQAPSARAERMMDWARENEIENRRGGAERGRERERGRHKASIHSHGKGTLQQIVCVCVCC